MKKITIDGVKAENNFILIDKYKFLFGTNDSIKYKIRTSIRRYYDRDPKVEYDIEKNIKNSVQINDKYVDLKKSYYFELTELFDLKEDIKLGTKSIFQRYYDLMLDKIQYNDIFISANNELKTLIDELNLKIYLDDLLINANLTDLSKKMILKMMELKIMKEELEISPLSLDYEDILLLQVELMKHIANLDYENEYLVILNVPILSKKIYDNVLHNMDNLNIIVFSYFLKDNFFIKDTDIAIVDEDIYDLLNDEQLYEMLLSSTKNYSIDELRKKIFTKHILLIKDIVEKDII